jgi:DNA-binding CsgD family transcriptional regulator
MAAMDRVEAAVRAGREDDALTWVDELERFGAASDAAWASAAAAHGRALLSNGDTAARHFERALKLHAGSGHRFEAARTDLAFGELLRRSRRRVDARDHLRAALQTFEDLRAGPWAQRARQELRASGESARKRDATTTDELTAQERQVARLVGQGMSNREAAAQLFLSPRTIDFHLRNVYAKVGISSRRELARLQLG